MSLKYLHLFLIFRLAFTGFSLALGYPNQRTPSEYRPISPPSYRQPGHKPSPEHQQLFHKPRMPIILRHPETLKKPLVKKHRPSSDVSTSPHYILEPPPACPENPVCRGNNPPPEIY
ncbi:hypothetical protein POM88_026572 [Heracleum sosnowskyi]|uniref:Uncharacterized protein n=1 Tax=Heracleum sosnowskyi TaxID=360622 RepID=A0AAD8I8J3_9APIA|nr:hypothetical protein POM88_026572 [Heracleum sosnowskyi]